MNLIIRITNNFSYFKRSIPEIQIKFVYEYNAIVIICIIILLSQDIFKWHIHDHS